MLADPEALRVVIGTDVKAQDLGLPIRPHQAESDPHPKQTLQQAVHNALAGRSHRRRMDLRTIYEPLARQPNLERLSVVPAYQQFVNDMVQTLVALHLVE